MNSHMFNPGRKNKYYACTMHTSSQGSGIVLFPTSLCGAFVFSSASRCLRLRLLRRHLLTPPRQPQLTQLSHNFSHTTPLTQPYLTQLISHNSLTQLHSHNSPHTTYLPQLLSHNLISHNSTRRTQLTQLTSHNLSLTSLSRSSTRSTQLTHLNSYSHHHTSLHTSRLTILHS